MNDVSLMRVADTSETLDYGPEPFGPNGWEKSDLMTDLNIDTRRIPASAGTGLGFATLDRERTIEQLPLSGSLPPWLTGSLLRTGPARFEVGEQSMRHWFDGLAMLHRFTIADGRVSYGNRYLQSRAYRAAQAEGRIAFSEFATDPCRSLFQRVQTLFSSEQSISDNGNVNIARLGERFVAMTETPLPVEFDARTLEAAEAPPFRAPGQLTTAHPHLDRDGGAMLNYAAKLGPRSSYRFFTVDPGGGEPRPLASQPVKEPAYMHSFGLTERWIVLAEFPYVVNPLALALSGRPYIENYRWKPERGTRFTLIDRRTGAKGPTFRTDPCFSFHHVNAFEQGEEVIVDLCAYPDAGIVEDLYLERLRAGKPITPAALTRFRLDTASGEVGLETLTDRDLELPRINYGACNERPYRYVWGTGSGAAGWLEEVVKADTHERTSLSWSEPGCYAGEPVFVAEPGAEHEDAGVLLSVVLDARVERSFLLVLDAMHINELARAEVPHHIPFGFHGQFARG
jgi:beta,beta-carotene 9',10'-dioxygenase